MGGGILLRAWSRRGLDWAPTYEIHLLYVMSKFQFLKVLTLCTAVMQHVDESSFRHSCVVIQLKEDKIHEVIHKHEARSTNIDRYLSDLRVSPILPTRCHWWENHAHVQGMSQSQWIPTKTWIWPTWWAWSWPTLIKTIIKKLIPNWTNPFWMERAFSAVLRLATENQQHSWSRFLCSWLALGV